MYIPAWKYIIRLGADFHDMIIVYWRVAFIENVSVIQKREMLKQHIWFLLGFQNTAKL